MIIRFCLLLNMMAILSMSVTAQVFEQANVANIVVDGVELLNPFAGGLNSPQLSDADLNNDGVDDVLIFDRIGSAILPMINDAGTYRYDPTIIANFPAIEHFLLMKDYNADGIADIFSYSTELGVSGISVYRGKYTNGLIDFDKVNFPDVTLQVLNFELANGSFSNIAVLDSDIPSIEDIDGDGDLDIVTFNFLGGQVEFYQNLVVERNETLEGFFFVKKEDCYGGIYESGLDQMVSLANAPGECATPFQGGEVATRHAGSSCLSIDHDGDGDFELLLGDLSFNNITLLENGGDEDEAWFNRQIVNYPDMASEPVDIPIFPAAFYLDADGDGVKDFISAPNNINNSLDVKNVWFYKNNGTDNLPEFSLTTKGLFVDDMLDLGTAANPAFADVDADGLLDMVIGTQTTFVPFGDRDGRLYLFLNTGTSEDPVFELTDTNWLDYGRFKNDAFDFVPAFADLDNDGDMDLYVGETNGHIYYSENTAGPGSPMSFNPIVTNYLDIDIGKLSAPTFYDGDNDGLVDMIIGERNGNVNFLKNIGTATNPNFNPDLEATGNSESYGQLDARVETEFVGYSKPTVIRIDEGDFIMMGIGSGAIEMFRIDHDINSTFELTNSFLNASTIGQLVVPAFVDVNNDGMLEAIVGNWRGGLTSFNTDLKEQSVSTSSIETPTIKLRSNLIQSQLVLQGDEPANFTVFNTVGQQVAAAKLSNCLNISNLSSGVYFVQLERNGKANTVKVIKQ